MKLQEVPEVECYASTYPSNNGEAHLYQELPDRKGEAKPQQARGATMGSSRPAVRCHSNQRAEPEGALQSRAWPKPALKSRAHTMSLSREAVGPKPHHDPLRSTLGFTSRFSETNLLASRRAPPPPREHPPPYSEVVKTSKRPAETPYLVSRPSVSSSMMNMSSRPRMASGTRLMSSLQNIPDETSSVGPVIMNM